MKLRRFIYAFLLFIQPLQIYAAVTAVTSDGQSVILNEDGTYKYLNNGKSASNGQEQDEKYQSVDIVDLQVDITSLHGKRIKVNAAGVYMANALVITSAQNSYIAIGVDITKLPREQKKSIINSCNSIVDLCSVTIFGTVGEVSYQEGVIADNAEIN